jgi:large subunit ribosomal protein L11
MAKKITGYVRLQIPAGAAAPAPPVGPALGQRGLNIMEFCKAFNARTASLEKQMPIPVVITVYQDRSFSFITKKPPVTYYLKKAANIKTGASTPGRASVGSVTLEQIKKIAAEKIEDLNCTTHEAAINMILGSAKSIGIKVVN